MAGGTIGVNENNIQRSINVDILKELTAQGGKYEYNFDVKIPQVMADFWSSVDKLSELSEKTEHKDINELTYPQDKRDALVAGTIIDTVLGVLNPDQEKGNPLFTDSAGISGLLSSVKAEISPENKNRDSVMVERIREFYSSFSKTSCDSEGFDNFVNCPARSEIKSTSEVGFTVTENGKQVAYNREDFASRPIRDDQKCFITEQSTQERIDRWKNSDSAIPGYVDLMRAYVTGAPNTIDLERNARGIVVEQQSSAVEKPTDSHTDKTEHQSAQGSIDTGAALEKKKETEMKVDTPSENKAATEKKGEQPNQDSPVENPAETPVENAKTATGTEQAAASTVESSPQTASVVEKPSETEAQQFVVESAHGLAEFYEHKDEVCAEIRVAIPGEEGEDAANRFSSAVDNYTISAAAQDVEGIEKYSNEISDILREANILPSSVEKPADNVEHAKSSANPEDTAKAERIRELGMKAFVDPSKGIVLYRDNNPYMVKATIEYLKELNKYSPEEYSRITGNEKPDHVKTGLVISYINLFNSCGVGTYANLFCEALYKEFEKRDNDKVDRIKEDIFVAYNAGKMKEILKDESNPFTVELKSFLGQKDFDKVAAAIENYSKSGEQAAYLKEANHIIDERERIYYKEYGEDRYDSRDIVQTYKLFKDTWSAYKTGENVEIKIPGRDVTKGPASIGMVFAAAYNLIFNGDVSHTLYKHVFMELRDAFLDIQSKGPDRESLLEKAPPRSKDIEPSKVDVPMERQKGEVRSALQRDGSTAFFDNNDHVTRVISHDKKTGAAYIDHYDTETLKRTSRDEIRSNGDTVKYLYYPNGKDVEFSIEKHKDGSRIEHEYNEKGDTVQAETYGTDGKLERVRKFEYRDDHSRERVTTDNYKDDKRCIEEIGTDGKVVSARFSGIIDDERIDAKNAGFAKIQIQDGRFERAKEYLDGAGSYADKSDYEKVGKYFLEKNDFEKAAECYQKAGIESGPDVERAQKGCADLGNIELKNDTPDLDRAKSYLDKAGDQADKRDYVRLGELFVKQGKDEQAIECFRKGGLIDKDIRVEKAHADIGREELNKKTPDLEKVRDHFSKAGVYVTKEDAEKLGNSYLEVAKDKDDKESYLKAKEWLGRADVPETDSRMVEADKRIERKEKEEIESKPRTEITYNKDGKIDEITKYKKGGDISSVTKYEYHPDGTLAKEITDRCFAAKEDRARNITTYDAKGKVETGHYATTVPTERWAEIGDKCEKVGRFEQAISCYTRGNIDERDPRVERAHAGAGREELQNDKPDLEKVKAHFDKAGDHVVKEEFESLGNQFLEAAKDDPSKFQEAKKCFDRASVPENDPRQVEAAAGIEKKANDDDAAIVAEAEKYLASAKGELEKGDSADLHKVESDLTAAGDHVDTKEAWTELGNRLEGNGDHLGAISAWEKGGADNNSELIKQAYAALAKEEMAKPDLDYAKAYDYLDKAGADKAEWHELGTKAYENDHFEIAASALERGGEDSNSDIVKNAHAEAGKAELDSQDSPDLKKVYEHFEKAGDNISVSDWESLGKSFLSAGDYIGAIDSFKEAKIDSGTDYDTAKQGCIDLAHKELTQDNPDLDKVISSLDHALPFSMGQTEFEKLGDLLEKEGRHQEAMDAWENGGVDAEDDRFKNAHAAIAKDALQQENPDIDAAKESLHNAGLDQLSEKLGQGDQGVADIISSIDGLLSSTSSNEKETDSNVTAEGSDVTGSNNNQLPATGQGTGVNEYNESEGQPGKGDESPENPKTPDNAPQVENPEQNPVTPTVEASPLSLPSDGSEPPANPTDTGDEQRPQAAPISSEDAINDKIIISALENAYKNEDNFVDSLHDLFGKTISSDDIDRVRGAINDAIDHDTTPGMETQYTSDFLEYLNNHLNDLDNLDKLDQNVELTTAEDTEAKNPEIVPKNDDAEVGDGDETESKGVD